MEAAADLKTARYQLFISLTIIKALKLRLIYFFNNSGIFSQSRRLVCKLLVKVL